MTEATASPRSLPRLLECGRRRDSLQGHRGTPHGCGRTSRRRRLASEPRVLGRPYKSLGFSACNSSLLFFFNIFCLFSYKNRQFRKAKSLLLIHVHSSPVHSLLGASGSNRCD